MISRAWTYCGSRVPNHRVRTEALLPTVWRVGFRSSTRGRRRPRQSYHCRHDETTRQFGLWEDGHRRRSPPGCQVLHGGWHVGAHQQQAVPTTGRRHRRRVRNRVEQASREVHSSTPHRYTRLPVRQAPHATVLLRLYRQVRRTTAVPVLRDGHRFGIHCASRRDHRRSRHFGTPRALLPPQIRMVACRMWRQARG